MEDIKEIIEEYQTSFENYGDLENPKEKGKKTVKTIRKIEGEKDHASRIKSFFKIGISTVEDEEIEKNMKQFVEGMEEQLAESSSDQS